MRGGGSIGRGRAAPAMRSIAACKNQEFCRKVVAAIQHCWASRQWLLHSMKMANHEPLGSVLLKWYLPASTSNTAAPSWWRKGFTAGESAAGASPSVTSSGLLAGT